MGAVAVDPSLERFAKVLHDELNPVLASDRLALTLKLWENERDWAGYGSE